MLTKVEAVYFRTITNKLLNLFQINVSIHPLDHRLFLNTENSENVLGCCHRFIDNDGNIQYLITIDESYIRACYYGRQTKYSLYSDDALIETICHEIAHIFFWTHDKDHEKLTKELYNTYKHLIV